MNIARVKQLAEMFGRQRILVVGDLMLDKYIHGSVDRISPEAPVPVVRVGRERQVPGGAANVASNICAFGGQAVIAGIVGNDAAGNALRWPPRTIRRRRSAPVCPPRPRRPGIPWMMWRCGKRLKP